MKNIVVTLLFVLGLSTSYAQDINVEEVLNNKSYTFHATSTMPLNSPEISKVLSKMAGAMGSGNIILNASEYYVTFSNSKISSQLPYYGRAYSSEMNSNDRGMKFESTKFSEKIRKNKRGSYQVDYKIEDTNSARNLGLTVQPNGQAMLVVISNTRESITYNGYIKANN